MRAICFSSLFAIHCNPKPELEKLFGNSPLWTGNKRPKANVLSLHDLMLTGNLQNRKVPFRPSSTETAELESPPRPSRWRQYVFPIACCLVILCQLFFAAAHWSQMCDESTHLYAGYRYWKCGDFGFGEEHPPLARLVAAAPLLGSGIEVNCSVPRRDEAWAALDWLYGNNWEMMLARSRAAVSIFGVGLCLLVWFAGRRMFGLAPAAIAAALLVFEPSFLASAALVNTDMALSFTFPLTVYAFYMWQRRRTTLRLLACGVCAGLTLCSKMSGLIVIPTLFMLALAGVWLRADGWRLFRRLLIRDIAAVAAMFVLAVGVMWCVYGFHRGARAGEGQPVTATLADSEIAGESTAVESPSGIGFRLLPEAYVSGMRSIRQLSSVPQRMFLLWRMHSRQRWYFFPVNMLVRYTVPTLLLLVLGTWGAKWLWRKRPRETLFLFLPGAMFLLMTVILNGMVSSIRHVLPLLFFVVLWAAAGTWELARRRRWVKYVVAGALVFQAASSLHAFPAYSSYANELWGGPANAYRLLSNNHSGEALKQVKEYLDKHPRQPCWLVHPYLMSIQPYQVPCREFGGSAGPIPPHVRGTIILDSVFLENGRQEWVEPIVKGRTPVARIAGSSFLVYEGDFDTRKVSGITYGTLAFRQMNEGDFGGAVKNAAAAVDASPGNEWARFQYCRALVGAGMVQEAGTQCDITRALLQEQSVFRHQTDAMQAINAEADATAIRGVTEAVTAGRLRRNGEFAAALEHARHAMELAPQTTIANFEYCQALAINRRVEAAERACSTAQVLARSHPAANRNWIDPSPGIESMLELLRYAIGE